MDSQRILTFLNHLVCNNNRDWFHAHKNEYDYCRQDFEQFTAEWIERMIQIDPNLQGLTPKDCIWRIYRDTRFSPDKTPYKNHFGSFIAQKGGKKSEYAGYYLHLQPDGQCMFAAGMWCPNPELLKAVRQALYDNSDEVEEIINNTQFKKYFNDFDTYSSLKKVPSGYPADFEHANWLKLKTFTFSLALTDNQVSDPDFMNQLMDICQSAKPMNDFLNYTFQEL